MTSYTDEEILGFYNELIENSIEEENTCKNALFLKFYDLLLKEEANLIYDLSKTDEADIMFAVHHYLALNGYLSANRKFVISASPDELYIKPEISICIGSGCCRHIAPHFFQIMNKINSSNIKTYKLVGTNYINWKSKLTPAKEIKYHIDNDSFDNFNSDDDTTDYSYPNHIEVLSIGDKTIYDPLNFNIQRINFNVDNVKNYIGPIDLAMGIIYDSNFNGEDKQKMLEDLFYENLCCLERHQLTDEELINIRKIGIDICLANMDKIKSHQEKNERVYQYIKKETQKYTHNYLKNR